MSKLFIVNAKGLLKLILHFFLTYSYFLRSFLVFYRTIYNSHICSLYHSLVHFIIPCTQWCHLCADCLHSDHPHTLYPWILISHSFVLFPVHLFNHIETWVFLSACAWPVTKKRKREKTGIWHVEIDKKICKNDMTENFIKRDPNYSSGGY